MAVSRQRPMCSSMAQRKRETKYMINPYDDHPDMEPVKKKCNNILTLEQVRDTINKQCEEILSSPDRVWGFTRDHIVEYFEEVLEELEKKCQTHS